MLCRKCGVTVAEGDRYCRQCGRPIYPETKKKPRWVKFLFGFIVFFVVLFVWGAIVSDDLSESVEAQLKAIRAHKITEAYYQYTSSEFQSDVSLSNFRDLIEAYEELSKSKDVHWTEEVIHDGLATLKGILTTSDNTLTPITYELKKENNIWKVHGILLSTPSSGLGQSPALIDWLSPIDAQLRSLRENKTERAYNETTSKDFRASSTLEDFQKYVDQYPILKTHQSIIVSSQELKKNQADVTVILNPDKEAIPVKYMLVQEDGKWKIWNLYVNMPYSPEVTALISDPKSLRPVVEGFLQTLQKGEIENAYDDYLAKDFQKTTSFSDLQEFLKKYPIVRSYEAFTFGKATMIEATGTQPVELTFKDGKAIVDFVLGIQGDKWKIWGIKVVQYTAESSSDIPSQATGAEPTEVSTKVVPPGGIEFDRVEVGSSIDDKGDIVDPQKVVQAPSGDIHLNVFVRNGEKGNKVELIVEHVGTHTIFPKISTALQQDGDSRLSFSFGPPSKGWPKGRYIIHTTSSTGVTRNFVFDIK